MSFLLDTNVLSELRKGPRADSNVLAWFDEVQEGEIYLSVLVLGEIRRGVESIRRRDPEGGAALDVWLSRLCATYDQRILLVTRAIAELWGLLNVPDPLPAIDGLLAATALAHDLTLVTRNVRDIYRTGVAHLDPFER